MDKILMKFWFISFMKMKASFGSVLKDGGKEELKEDVSKCLQQI